MKAFYYLSFIGTFFILSCTQEDTIPCTQTQNVTQSFFRIIVPKNDYYTIVTWCNGQFYNVQKQTRLHINDLLLKNKNDYFVFAFSDQKNWQSSIDILKQPTLNFKLCGLQLSSNICDKPESIDIFYSTIKRSNLQNEKKWYKNGQLISHESDDLHPIFQTIYNTQQKARTFIILDTDHNEYKTIEFPWRQTKSTTTKQDALLDIKLKHNDNRIIECTQKQQKSKYPLYIQRISTP